MPLRDHFHPPLSRKRSWEELHGQWPAVMVLTLTRKLPPRYMAGPRVHLGPCFEIDVASFEKDELTEVASAGDEEEGGVATAVWAPPRPTWEVATDLPDQDEYEVRVYDEEHERRLVAAVETRQPSQQRPSRIAARLRGEVRRPAAARCVGGDC
jgi:hypothetical protein